MDKGSAEAMIGANCKTMIVVNFKMNIKTMTETMIETNIEMNIETNTETMIDNRSVDRLVDDDREPIKSDGQLGW